MLELVTTSKFRKDVKRMRKRGIDLSELEVVITALCNEVPLDDSYHDHALTGNLNGFRECHIAPDWLLIYAIDHKELILTASRTGSHSDLF